MDTSLSFSSLYFVYLSDSPQTREDHKPFEIRAPHQTICLSHKTPKHSLARERSLLLRHRMADPNLKSNRP
ncbi:hypothetical protein NC651_008116 [Populus alba x Populus x berolinensis]|nr:hypothetical protein NC651_008116 [Populus alba x Populus x berolinensis]